MDERSNANRRQRKRRPKWQQYIPTVIVSVLALIALASVITAVIAGIRHYSNQNDDPNHVIQNNPTSSSTTKPTEPTKPSQDIIDAQVDEQIAKADFYAKGYDYDKAIQMLKESEYFGENQKLGAKIVEYTKAKGELVKFPIGNNITHIFFHSLIVDTDRAFDNDEDSDGYNLYMTTVKEFKAILEEMYNNGYVLVSPYDIAYEVTDESGTYFKKGEIWLPSGKKPFLMSQDDVNYYSYMVGTGNGKNKVPVFADTHGDGFAHKIVIGEDGFPTCEYMDKDGNITTGDYDLVPVLERFIQEHPDFSYRGARAILGMTGYEGVFGYRTKPTYAENMTPEAYAKEVADAKAVAQCLREHGWILASHSYGHPRYGDLTPQRVEEDSTKWENTVESIIGATDVILFPHGSDIGNWRNYAADNEKFQVLYEDGYRYFFNVDSNQYWNQFGKTYFRGGRRNLDGYRMYHNPDKLADLFEVSKVFDEARPTPVPSLSGGM